MLGGIRPEPARCADGTDRVHELLGAVSILFNALDGVLCSCLKLDPSFRARLFHRLKQFIEGGPLALEHFPKTLDPLFLRSGKLLPQLGERSLTGCPVLLHGRLQRSQL